MRFALHEHPDGVETKAGGHVVYDVARNEAFLGAARVDGPALVWELDGSGEGAALSTEVDLDPAVRWLVRCDRVDFPPGAIAYRHVHPGPGIRRVLFGELTVEAGGRREAYGPGGAWLEGADYPVVATAWEAGDAAFARVLLLPAEWEGRRTVRYLDPADEEKPKLQRATVFLEAPLER